SGDSGPTFAIYARACGPKLLRALPGLTVDAKITEVRFAPHSRTRPGSTLHGVARPSVLAENRRSIRPSGSPRDPISAAVVLAVHATSVRIRRLAEDAIQASSGRCGNN